MCSGCGVCTPECHQGLAGETEEAFEGRLKSAATWVNDNHDVEGLCREMPRRMSALVHVTKGARLDK